MTTLEILNADCTCEEFAYYIGDVEIIGCAGDWDDEARCKSCQARDAREEQVERWEQLPQVREWCPVHPTDEYDPFTEEVA